MEILIAALLFSVSKCINDFGEESYREQCLPGESKEAELRLRDNVIKSDDGQHQLRRTFPDQNEFKDAQGNRYRLPGPPPETEEPENTNEQVTVIRHGGSKYEDLPHGDVCVAVESERGLVRAFSKRGEELQRYFVRCCQDSFNDLRGTMRPEERKGCGSPP